MTVGQFQFMVAYYLYCQQLVFVFRFKLEHLLTSQLIWCQLEKMTSFYAVVLISVCMVIRNKVVSLSYVKYYRLQPNKSHTRGINNRLLNNLTSSTSRVRQGDCFLVSLIFKLLAGAWLDLKEFNVLESLSVKKYVCYIQQISTRTSYLPYNQSVILFSLSIASCFTCYRKV